MSTRKIDRSDLKQKDAFETLRDLIREGSTVYCLCARSASNMTGFVRLMVIKDGEPLFPTYSAAIVCKMPLVERDGYDWIKVGGCGYNRADHVVGILSHALYGDERALKSRII